MTAPTTETLAGLLALQQPGTFKYERNQSYDSHKGSPIQGHVIRYIPHPKDLGDGRKAYGFSFPALVASELLGEPEEFMRAVADQLNACPTLAAEVIALRARVAELEGAQQWQEIESAPQEGKFLVGGWLGDGPNHPPTWEVEDAWREDDGFACDVNLDGETMMVVIERVTHWMPLPQPPSAALNPTEEVE